MKVKYKGEWHEIKFINAKENREADRFITENGEQYIEDIEINGRHLGKEVNFPTKTEATRKGEANESADYL